jgi:hypothetical protein
MIFAGCWLLPWGVGEEGGVGGDGAFAWSSHHHYHCHTVETFPASIIISIVVVTLIDDDTAIIIKENTIHMTRIAISSL